MFKDALIIWTTFQILHHEPSSHRLSNSSKGLLNLWWLIECVLNDLLIDWLIKWPTGLIVMCAHIIVGLGVSWINLGSCVCRVNSGAFQAYSLVKRGGGCRVSCRGRRISPLNTMAGYCWLCRLITVQGSHKVQFLRGLIVGEIRRAAYCSTKNGYPFGFPKCIHVIYIVIFSWFQMVFKRILFHVTDRKSVV